MAGDQSCRKWPQVSCPPRLRRVSAASLSSPAPLPGTPDTCWPGCRCPGHKLPERPPHAPRTHQLSLLQTLQGNPAGPQTVCLCVYRERGHPSYVHTHPSPRAHSTPPANTPPLPLLCPLLESAHANAHTQGSGPCPGPAGAAVSAHSRCFPGGCLAACPTPAPQRKGEALQGSPCPWWPPLPNSSPFTKPLALLEGGGDKAPPRPHRSPELPPSTDQSPLTSYEDEFLDPGSTP